MGDREFSQQSVEHFFAAVAVRFNEFNHRPQILFDGQSPKDRCFLGQVTNSKPRPAIHRQVRDIVPIHQDGSVIRGDQTRNDIKTGRLSCAIRPQQSNRFAAVHRHGDIAKHWALFETLPQRFCDQPAFPRILRDQSGPTRPLVAAPFLSHDEILAGLGWKRSPFMQKRANFGGLSRNPPKQPVWRSSWSDQTVSLTNCRPAKLDTGLQFSSSMSFDQLCISRIILTLGASARLPISTIS